MFVGLNGTQGALRDPGKEDGNKPFDPERVVETGAGPVLRPFQGRNVFWWGMVPRVRCATLGKRTLKNHSTLKGSQKPGQVRRWDPFRVEMFVGLNGTQGALRDPGLRSSTPFGVG